MSPSISIKLLATQSDERLAQLTATGHERAFEALVQRHRRALLRHCRRMLLSDERAEDAVQQGLMRAWVALQGATAPDNPRAWLYRIVHNVALDSLRDARYDYVELTEALRGSGAPDEDLDRRIAVREALAGLAALPELQRQALLRTAVEGQSADAAAADLHVSDGQLRGLIYRARATMRAAATALTPWPLVSWIAGSAAASPLTQRLGEITAGAGSAGLAGALVKGATVAVTAGVLVGGIAGHTFSGLARHVGLDAGRHATHAAASGVGAPEAHPALRATAAITGPAAAAGAAGGGEGNSAVVLSQGQGNGRKGHAHKGISGATLVTVGAHAPVDHGGQSDHGGGDHSSLQSGGDQHSSSGTVTTTSGHDGGGSGTSGGGDHSGGDSTPGGPGPSSTSSSGSGGGGSGSSDGGSSGSHDGGTPGGSGSGLPLSGGTTTIPTTTTSGDSSGSRSSGHDGSSSSPTTPTTPTTTTDH